MHPHKVCKAGKEAFFFHKPCVTLREETEWVELVDGGFNLLAGADPQRMMSAFESFIDQSIDFRKDLYGNGHSGNKIKNIIINQLNK